MKRIFQQIILIFFIAIFITGEVQADSSEKKVFFIESRYDLFGREKISARLEMTGEKLYFYVDEEWWQDLDEKRRREVKEEFRALDKEFYSRIYPGLVSTFGSEWRPGIDNDEKITILFHPMRDRVKGYYRTADEYPKFQSPFSNEREMVYLNANSIGDPSVSSYLAHEFQHLITFNQKERKYNLVEEIWLQEGISEIAPTIVGYDRVFENSYLKQRVEIFLQYPSDSLTEWQGKVQDYGALNLFMQYLIDHYGTQILIDALHSRKTGIASLNYALKKNGFQKNFAQIFRDWTIAVLINDCSFGQEYCYRNENLANLRVTPSLNFLPYVVKTSLKIEDNIQDWSGKWYKLMGGKGSFTLEFDGRDDVHFHVAYWACEKKGKCFLKTLELDEKQSATFTIPNFGKKFNFLVLILSIQEKERNFGQAEIFYPFVLKISTNDQETLIQELLERIAFLEAEIAKIQAKIERILKERKKAFFSCQKLEKNLYFGLRNSNQVRCLQEFLKSQGPEIYPEGLVTGNFLNLTKVAVLRFQEKYASEILAPLGLQKGTGFVGPLTRAKINQLLTKFFL